MKIQFLNDASEPVNKPDNEPVHWRVCLYGAAIRDGKLLVVKQQFNDGYGLPGGGQELGETVEGGLKREFREEVGCEVEMLEQMPIARNETFYYSIRNKKFFHAILLFFKVQLKSEPRKTEDEDTKAFEWVPIQDLNESNCHPMIMPAINAIQNANK